MTGVAIPYLGFHCYYSLRGTRWHMEIGMCTPACANSQRPTQAYPHNAALTVCIEFARKNFNRAGYMGNVSPSPADPLEIQQMVQDEIDTTWIIDKVANKGARRGVTVHDR
jgi:hypothetical protein